jgi:hypothetical protein
MDNINKMYLVQFINHISGNHEVIGVFRDERIANEFSEDRNKSQSLLSPEVRGIYIVHPIYTDF